MTRASTNGNGHRDRVAALHASGGAWRLVVIETGGPGAGGRARVAQALTLGADDAAGVRDAMQQAGADHLVRVAPAEQTVCRVQPAQAGDPQQTAAAMALIAEAELSGVAPPWRIAAGLIEDGADGMALLTAWREAPGGATPAQVHPDETWTTEIAALAALRGGAGQLALAASRASGVVSLLASGARATVARTVREANDTADRWRAAVIGAAEETCAQVEAEIDTSEISGDDRADLLDAAKAPEALVWLDTTALDALRGRVAGVGAGRSWLNDYGVALGAALLAASDDPGRAQLARLRASAPVQRRPMAERVVDLVSSPRRAGAILAAALALIVLMPLVVAWGRVALLEAGADRAASFQDERSALAREAALYEQLENSRLPMTRLLADISGATPPHVVIDRLRLSRDQGLTLEGRVHVVAVEAGDGGEGDGGQAAAPENPQELVTALERNLAATGVFGGIRVTRSEVSAGSVLFEMTARVDRPHANPKPAIDFAERSLAQLLYGERGDNTARPVALSEPARSARPAGSRRAESGSGSSDSAADSGRDGAREESREAGRETSSRRPDGEGSASQDGIPAELTDAEIEAMDSATAMRAMVARMTARNKSAVDEATKARLNAEIAKLQAQKDKAAGGGS